MIHSNCVDVCAAPVIDVRTGEFVGVVSEADAVLAALQRLREEVSAGVAAATRALGKFEATAPLLGACRRLVGGEVGTVGIFADGGLLHTLEGSRVLRFVRTRVGSDAGLLGACVADLRVGTWSGVMTVAWDVSVREGLEVLARGGWGGVPVVEEGRVVDVLWRSDCLSGVPGTALELPLRGWLRGMRAARNGVVCDRNVSLGSVFEQMEKGRSRIFVEEDGNVVGVVTLRDVLRFFLD